jgi:signal transduction histidine kinase
MRPPSLIRFGLSRALQVFIEAFRERNPSIEVQAELMDDGDRLSEQARLNLFRIAQESLNNTVKHAQATRISVQLRAAGHQLILEIQDNGRGFTATEDLIEYSLNGHYGLVGMKERAEAIDGKLILTSEPGKGTSIQVAVPVK